MTIESGLSEGEVLVMNPRAHPQKLNLPDLPDLQKPALPTIAAGTTANDTSSGRPGPTFVAAPDVDGRGAGPNGSGRPASAGGEGGRPGGDFDPARIFAALDTDGDGVLSAQELQNVPADRRGRILAADADGDGTVTREEFMRAMSALAGGVSRGGDAGR
jgi:HlyD family secretion protein